VPHKSECSCTSTHSHQARMHTNTQIHTHTSVHDLPVAGDTPAGVVKRQGLATPPSGLRPPPYDSSTQVYPLPQGAGVCACPPPDLVATGVALVSLFDTHTHTHTHVLINNRVWPRLVVVRPACPWQLPQAPALQQCCLCGTSPAAVSASCKWFHPPVLSRTLPRS